jgi:hypothetical protein
MVGNDIIYIKTIIGRSAGNFLGFIINLLIGDYNTILIDFLNSNFKDIIFGNDIVLMEMMRLRGPGYKNFGYIF